MPGAKNVPDSAEPAVTDRRQICMKTSSFPYLSSSRDRLSAASALAVAALLLVTTSTVAANASQRTAQANDSSCWTSEPGVVGVIDHPTDPAAIVLRMTTGGGFVPVEIAFMETPVFTLYGNNVAIFRPASVTNDITDPLAPYFCAQLRPDEVDELLAFALDQGGLRTADELYADPFIADAPNTLFTFDADGVSNEIMVQALGFNPDAPDAEAREQFEALADLLTDYEPEVDAAEPYQVELYRGLLSDVWTENPATPLSWPWDDLSPDDFIGEGFDSTYLLPDQVAQVAVVPSGGQGFILLLLPDGTLRSLTVSPLLPDQVADIDA